MRVFREPKKIRDIDYFLVFYYEDGLSGFRFPCDYKGRIAHLPSLAFENYNRCLSKELPVSNPILEKDETVYSMSAVALCDCGQELLLTKDYNECPACMVLYNSSGTKIRLAI